LALGPPGIGPIKVVGGVIGHDHFDFRRVLSLVSETLTGGFFWTGARLWILMRRLLLCGGLVRVTLMGYKLSDMTAELLSSL
jgi:hypothetical protein